MLPVLALCLTLAPSPGFTPTDQTGWFPFVIPDLADAATDRAALDLSFLSPEPAGTHGFLRPRGERLVDERGVVVRLIGSNITDYHPMMPKEQAEPCARRLRQLGVNFIRLHYYDWDVAPNGILNPDRQTPNPEKLDQLDWLIHQLIRHGVYVDLNLHVARTYPDLPPGWHRMGKGLDLIHEPYIQSQLQFARDMVGHRNPYSGRRYADEPGIAVIELNNENSALNGWDRYARLPERFSAPLQTLWNAWLKAHYGTSEQLLAAWGAGDLGGPELLRNADLSRGTADWVYQKAGGEGGLAVEADASAPGGRLLRWQVTAAGGATWHHQLQQPDLPVRDGGRYTLTVRGRSTSGVPLKVTVMMQEEPWGTVAGGGELRFGPDWTEQTLTFEVAPSGGHKVRLNLSAENKVGTWDLAGLSLRAGAPPALAAGQRIEDGTVPLVGGSSARRQANDYVRFLLDREMDTVRRLKTLLRDELGAKQVIYCTQVGYGGGAGLLRESRLGDAIDAHAYPDHPQDGADGKRHIRDVTLTGGGAAGLASLASERVAGKPFLVTEFDLNPPNDAGAQVFPCLALLAAYQDWSGILDYAWYNFGAAPGTASIKSSFGTVGVTGQIAFLPAAALMYRLGLVEPARQRLTLQVPEADSLAATARNAGGWDRIAWDQAGVSAAAAWTRAMAVEPVAAGELKASATLKVEPGAPLTSDTGQLAYDRTPGHEVLTANAPAFRLATGSLAGKTLTLGDVTLTVGAPLFRDFAQVALVALDGKPLAETRQALLTVGARTESTGMAWSADHTSVTWGEAPTLAEPVPLTVKLPAGAWTAKLLDAKGVPCGQRTLAGATLVTQPGDRTMWYLLTR